MKKEEYLERLKYYLEERDFSKEELDEIMEDYAIMIDEALEKDVFEEDLMDILGDPREISKQIQKRVVLQRVKSNKLVALSPFFTTIIFFVLGFGFELWHPGWMVYLLVPMIGVFSGRRKSPLKHILELLPFFTLIVFLGIGLTTNVWSPTWAIFLLIPAFRILDTNHLNKRLWFILFLLISVVYVMSVLFFPFTNNWLMLLLLIIPAVNGGIIKFTINGVHHTFLSWNLGVVVVTSVVAFLLIGFYTGYWHPGWLVFFSIPITTIIGYSKVMKRGVPLISIMPFIATTFFFLAGEFLDGYLWSWMFFFLIPITSILKGYK